MLPLRRGQGAIVLSSSNHQIAKSPDSSTEDGAPESTPTSILPSVYGEEGVWNKILEEFEDGQAGQ